MLSAAAELIPNAFQDSDATDTEMSTRQQCTLLLDTGALGAMPAPPHGARPWPPPCAAPSWVLVGDAAGNSSGPWPCQGCGHTKAMLMPKPMMRGQQEPVGAVPGPRDPIFLPFPGVGPALPGPIPSLQAPKVPRSSSMNSANQRGDSQPLPTQEAAEHSPVSLLHRLVKCAN